MMASAYLAISFLKQTPLPEKQLGRFLSYLPQEPLKKYLYYENIYKGRKNRSKQELIEIIITGKNIKARYKPEDDLRKEEANEILQNSDFAKLSSKENIKPINPPEIKIIKH